MTFWVGLALGRAVIHAQPTSADFLNLPVGSRSVALGETGVAFAEDAGSIFWNPGSMDFLPRTSFAAGRALYLDASHDLAAMTRSLGTAGTAGFGVSVLSYDPLSTVNVEGSPTGTLTLQEWQAVAGFGRRLRGPALLAGGGWGVSGKWISSDLDGTVQTLALDTGFLSRPTERWRWGIALTNMGRGLKRGETTESLPGTVRLGTAWSPSPAWTATSDLHWTKNKDLVLGTGVEFAHPVTPHSTFFARGGYTTDEIQTDPMNGLRMGFGALWKNIQVDYSFRFIQESAAAHALSLSFRLDTPETTWPPAIQNVVDRGQHQLKMNQYPEAVLTFDEALRLSPTCTPAWEGLEQARQRMGGQ
jgi:hypothetical protein